jgi:20S proteasome alpha/beta subunit
MRSKIEKLEQARHRVEVATSGHADDAKRAIDRAATAVQQAQEGLDEMTTITDSITAERLKNHFAQVILTTMSPPK